MKSNHDAHEAQEDGDTLPDQANVYVPPRQVAPLSEHRTMDVKAIRLAAELDPRQAMTMLRLPPPRRRRSISLVTLGSIALLVLAALGLYLVWLGDAPLPLMSSDSRPPEPEQTPVVVERVPISPSPAALPTAARTVALTAEPVPEPAPTIAERGATSTTGPATGEPASATEVPRPATKPIATPRPSAPKRTKVSRDPWLD